MNKFFVSNKVYEDRMAICKKCVYYSKVLGNCTVCKCFMKIKSRIASQSCPQKYWDKTTEVEMPEDLPQEIINEVLDVWKDLKTGRAKDQAAKKKMITIYNTVYNTNYSTGTNCGSCLSTCLDGVKKIYEKYNE
tara:strand:+ start:3899 stop:4300 length:402 start_codon:yes stop_codon:yes gene_type:complete